MQRKCKYCDEKATHVWVVEDPYYGYGHFGTLTCGSCDPKNYSEMNNHDSKHKYDPEYDDYFLGFESKPPPDWQMVINGKPELCWDCKSEVDPDKHGHGVISFNTPGDVYRHDHHLSFCKTCFIERGGHVGFLYEGLPDQELDDKLKSHKELTERFRAK